MAIGKKTGGRKKGTPNKSTMLGKEVIVSLLADYSNSGLMTSDFMALDPKTGSWLQRDSCNTRCPKCKPQLLISPPEKRRRQSKTASQNWLERTSNLLGFHFRQQPPDNPSAVFYRQIVKIMLILHGVSSNLMGVLFEETGGWLHIKFDKTLGNLAFIAKNLNFNILFFQGIKFWAFLTT